MQESSKLQFDKEISEEAKANFLKFLDEVREETANCSVVTTHHTNHSNHSNW